MERPTPLTRDGKCFYRSASMEDGVPAPPKCTQEEPKRPRARTSSFSREASDINVSRLPNAPQLPHVPYPVDPYHFSCQSTVDTKEAVPQIMRVLNRLDVDMVFQVHKCKFKCVKYVNYDRIDFIIRVYISMNKALLVECQRRSGSLLTWDTLYRQLYLELIGIIDVNAPTCPQSGSQKKVLNESVAITLPVAAPLSKASSGMEVFVIMLSSQFVDIRAEGCSAIAVATENVVTAHKAAACGLLTLLIAQLKEMTLYEQSKLPPFNAPIIPSSVRRDIVRCAVGAIANIADAFLVSHATDATIVSQFHPAIPLLVAWLHKESAPNDYVLRELQRECCRAIKTLVQMHPTSFNYAEWSILINFAARSRDDPKLAQYCDVFRKIFDNFNYAVK